LVRAFKEMTAATDDAAATRARVLDVAGRGPRGPLTPRRVALSTVAGVLVLGTASLAGTTLAQRWRRPAATTIAEPATDRATRERQGRHGTVVIPPAVALTTEVPRAPAASGAEAAAYGQAHRAHFGGGEPARALAAWDDYLRRYPHGAFVPEARFNRALCLVRLGRIADAERALRPFSDGGFGGYRRADADRLLDWLRERPAAP
ncbi:MAG TPA: tetratricopeptide repeat protein, partial [Polyangia bacterium]|nr:tetratricopeptide repeat protein [Polyangia bacterium]